MTITNEVAAFGKKLASSAAEVGTKFASAANTFIEETNKTIKSYFPSTTTDNASLYYDPIQPSKQRIASISYMQSFTLNNVSDDTNLLFDSYEGIVVYIRFIERHERKPLDTQGISVNDTCKYNLQVYDLTKQHSILVNQELSTSKGDIIKVKLLNNKQLLFIYQGRKGPYFELCNITEQIDMPAFDKVDNFLSNKLGLKIPEDRPVFPVDMAFRDVNSFRCMQRIKGAIVIACVDQLIVITPTKKAYHKFAPAFVIRTSAIATKDNKTVLFLCDQTNLLRYSIEHGSIMEPIINLVELIKSKLPDYPDFTIEDFIANKDIVLVQTITLGTKNLLRINLADQSVTQITLAPHHNLEKFKILSNGKIFICYSTIDEIAFETRNAALAVEDGVYYNFTLFDIKKDDFIKNSFYINDYLVYTFNGQDWHVRDLNAKHIIKSVTNAQSILSLRATEDSVYSITRVDENKGRFEFFEVEFEPETDAFKSPLTHNSIPGDVNFIFA